MRRAVFLDRDGVLTKLVARRGAPYSPLTLEEFEVVPTARAAVWVLKKLGLVVVVATNQPDVRRGLLSEAELRRMHEMLRRTVPIDAVYVCTHDDVDGCDCRKPKPGMLLRASKDFEIDLPASFLVGDTWKDIQAGKKVRCTTFLVETRATGQLVEEPDHKVATLQAAVEQIVQLVAPGLPREALWATSALGETVLG